MSCPILKTLVNEGWLHPDAQGWLSDSELYDSMRELGLDAVSSSALVEVARAVGGDEQGRINLDRVLRSGLRHNADFYRKQRLGELMGDREWIAVEDLGRAAQRRLQEEPGLHGRLQGGAELIAMLTVFGRWREGELIMTRHDLERLFIEHRFPLGWKPEPQRKMVVPAQTARYALNQVLEGLLSGSKSR